MFSQLPAMLVMISCLRSAQAPIHATAQIACEAWSHPLSGSALVPCVLQAEASGKKFTLAEEKVRVKVGSSPEDVLVQRYCSVAESARGP